MPGFSASSAGSDAGLFYPEFLSTKSAACSPEEPRPDRRVSEASWSAGFGREDQRAFRPGSSVVLEASATGGFRRSTPVLERATEKPHSGRRKPKLKATTGGRNGARLRAGKQALGSFPQAPT